MILAEHAYGKKLIGDGLQISAEAKERKSHNPNVIDATIGSLYNEDASFYKFKTIDNLLKSLNDVELYTYSPSDGGKQFKDAVLKWVFRDHKDYILNNMHTMVIATPGGTGAISNSIYNSCKKNDILLLPDLYWGPYSNMATSNELTVEKYQMIYNNKFNINEFILKSDEIIEKQNKLVTIINDPCNNPTGYSLTNDELEDIIEYFNSKENSGITLIYDIAYIDYANVGIEKTREKFLILAKAKKHILINIAYSASKSFSIYGLRTGAQIIMSKDKEIVNTAYDSSCFLARTRWSNSSKIGISLLTKIASNDDLFNKANQDITEAVGILNERAKIFIEESKIVGLDLYPYNGGFFITVKCNDSKTIFEKLKGSDIFVLPFPNAIRISISALSLREIKGLANNIKKTMDSLGKTN